MKTRKEHEAEIRWAQYLEGNACRMDDATFGKRIKIARRACLPVQGAGGNRNSNCKFLRPQISARSWATGQQRSQQAQYRLDSALEALMNDYQKATDVKP